MTTRTPSSPDSGTGFRTWLRGPDPHGPTLDAVATRLAALEARIPALERDLADARATVATLCDRADDQAGRIAALADQVDPVLRSADAWLALQDGTAAERERIDIVRSTLKRLEKQLQWESETSRKAEQALLARIDRLRADTVPAAGRDAGRNADRG